MFCLIYMPKLAERGIAHILFLLLLVVGLIVGVYLITAKTPFNFLPKAALSKPTGPETSFSLIGPSGCTANALLCALYGQHALQEEFEVKLYARSDIETANLFTAKMTFPKDLVEVKEIREGKSFGPNTINWVEDFYDNNTGEISLTGGVPAPGYQTQVNGPAGLMATITFRAKALGKGTVSFTDSSEILSNLNNINILTIKRGYDITVEVKPAPTPISGPISGCAYGSTQARVQKNLQDPWASSKTINLGEQIRVGGFHNETGLLANDVNLNVAGPKVCPLASTGSCTQATMNPANGAFINLSTPGTYTLTVTTPGQFGPACQDTATFQVQKCLPRPACLDAKPVSCKIPEPAGGWCPPTPGKRGNGDGNKDGKIDLVDMSILHTDWRASLNIQKTIREGIDMNGDGLVNSIDFATLRQKLQQLGVIKVRP